MKRSARERRYMQRMAMRAWWLSRAPVIALLGWLTVELILGADWVFLDYVNLALHEGGHMFFRWAGQTMHLLGGTLGQLLFPILFAIYFFRRSAWFSVVAMIWWWFQSSINVARYMADALPQRLPLVGGEIHDWATLMSQWGLLFEADDIAQWIRVIGMVGMVLSLGIMTWWTVFPSPEELEHSVRG
ncbi:MAG: hypothetical protein ACE366_30195 [Bradymonadia bacterium]